MANYGYIIDVQAKFGNLQAATAQIAAFAGKFTGLNDAVRTNQTLQASIAKIRNQTEGLTGSLESLENAKDNLLKQRHILPPESMNEIRAINLEVTKLDNRIDRLKSANGTQLSSVLSTIGNSIPGIGLLSNPIAMVGGALAKATYDAGVFETGMAKVNTTAKLGGGDLESLGGRLQDMAVNAGYDDLAKVPEAYDKILSTINDVDKSERILQVSLQGAAAGFADINTVAGAMTNVMAQLGNESKLTENQVANVLFAAKRVGAGELADFARYIPEINASAMSLKIPFEEVAGTFAYMTSKGIDAAQSGTLITNAYTALRKPDIRAGIKRLGIELEDADGKTRSMNLVMGDLAKSIKGMSDDQQINLLDKIGLHDSQAVQAFSLMTSDVGKFNEIMKATTSPLNEMADAFGNSEHTGRSLHTLMANMNSLLLHVGSYVLPVVNMAFVILTKVFEMLNPFIDALIIPLGYLGVTLLFQNYAAITAAISNSALALSMKSVGAAMMGIPGPGMLLAIAGGIAYAAYHSEKFREKVGFLIDKFWYLALPLGVALGLFIGIKVQAAWAAVSAAWAATSFGAAGVGGYGMASGLMAAAFSASALTMAIYNIPIVGWVLAAVAAIGTLLIAWTDFRIGVMSVLDVLMDCIKFVKYLFEGNWRAALSLSFDVTKHFNDRRVAEDQKEEEKKKNPFGIPRMSATDSPDAQASKAMINGAVKDSTGGGTRATQVTFTLGNIVENLNIIKDGFDEAAEDMESKLTEHLYRAFNMAMIGTTR